MRVTGDEPGQWSPRTTDLIVTPQPSDDELAAIIAAYQQLWPAGGGGALPASSPRWRYAGRPWIRRPRYGGWK